MKRFLLFHLLAFAFVFQAGAQAPQGINYQGVARDPEGKAVASKMLSVRISILKNSAGGELEFAEVHQVTTNQFGLFTLVIGQGSAVTGSFPFVSWAVGNKWLQIEMDVDGGSNYKIMGTQQLMSVPYAFYSQYSGNGLKAGTGISITNGTINNTGDADSSSTNELITGVSFGADHKLKITDAGATHEADLSSLLAAQDLTHVLSLGNDAGAQKITNLATPTNNSDAATKAYVDAHPDAQNLSLSAPSGTNRTINISGGTGVTIDVADADNNPTNEAQTLTKASNQISLSAVSGVGGGSVTLNDDDPVNEIQDLSLTSNILKINKNAAATSISLAPYLDNTDNQALTYTPSTNNLAIGGGNNVTITQTLNQVLAQGTDAGGRVITNAGAPVGSSDVTTRGYVDNAIATNFSFKVAYSFTNPGVVVTNQQVPLGVEDFDVFNVVGSNKFTVPANGAGIYVFYVDGTSSNTAIALKIRVNSTTLHPVKRQTSFPSPLVINDQQTLMLKLNAGDTVDLVVDSASTAESASGVLFGYKL